MALTTNSLQLIQQLRSQINQIENTQTRAMAAAWATAWDDLSLDLELALNEIADQAGEGRIRRSAVMRSERLTRSLDAIQIKLAALFDQSAYDAIGRLRDLVDEAGAQQSALTASQLPLSERASVTRWSRVDPAAITSIVERTTEQITKLSFPLSDEATAVMRRELVRGLAVGSNPRDTAARMLRATEGRFNGGLTRALTIARTETLDAQRAAAKLSDDANADVLRGWMWAATLSERTCPACWSMNGQEFPLTQAGPNGHQNCRCARVPVAKTWAELGFDIPEPPSLIPDAQSQFDALPTADQVTVLGRARYDAYQRGDYPMSDWATKRSNDGWRDSYVTSKVPAA